MAQDKFRSQKYVMPTGRLSYPSLFTKSKNDKYEATQIYTAADDLSMAEQAIAEACTGRWGADWKKSQGKKIKYPIHSCTDGVSSETGKRYVGYEEDEGRYIAFRNNNKPNIIHPRKDANGKYVLVEESEIWAGCYTRVSFYALAGLFEGVPYCSMRLENLVLIREGDALGGGSVDDPEDDFGDDFANDPELLAALGN